MVEIFADEGLSGMKAANREQFQRMIQMCELHQIDMIITKSVSRFARNVKEALEYCRKLKLLGIGVKFEKEGVFTLSMADEMLLNTFAAMAQEESKAISQNQRLSILKRMQSGEYVDSNAPYGYRLVDKQLSVYEPEAQVVRFIYHQYLKGHSTTEIARELNERGILTKTGKQIWRSSKVSYILRNEKYKGDSKYQKTYREMQNGQIIVDEDEADVIRSIYDNYVAGASLKAIAEQLTLRRVPYTEKTTVWDKARVARMSVLYTSIDCWVFLV